MSNVPGRISNIKAKDIRMHNKIFIVIFTDSWVKWIKFVDC